MNKYRVIFSVILHGYEDGIQCSMEFEADCDPEDSYAVGEQIVKGIKSVNFSHTERVE